MNSTITPIFDKLTTPSLPRISRVLAAISCIVFLTSVSAQAEPVQINKVAQTVSSLQGTTNLQLTLVSQDPAISGTRGSTASTNGPRNDNASGIGTNDPKLDALLSGFPIISDNNKIGVDEVSEEGEVEGTICDCGEILIAGGGFPAWPLAFLAAVPLVFIDFGEECVNCTQSTPTATPTPNSASTPTPTPEPASLLIFGTGLVAVGAGLRRRYTNTKLANHIQKTEEE